METETQNSSQFADKFVFLSSLEALEYVDILVLFDHLVKIFFV